MSPWDAEWLLQELIEDNPAICMLSVDARDLPLGKHRTVYRERKT